jgi:hypothetical protein
MKTSLWQTDFTGLKHGRVSSPTEKRKKRQMEGRLCNFIERQRGKLPVMIDVLHGTKYSDKKGRTHKGHSSKYVTKGNRETLFTHRGKFYCKDDQGPMELLKPKNLSTKVQSD